MFVLSKSGSNKMFIFGIQSSRLRTFIHSWTANIRHRHLIAPREYLSDEDARVTLEKLRSHATSDAEAKAITRAPD